MDGGEMEKHLLEEAKKELEKWETKVEKEDDVKARLILEKLSIDGDKATAQKVMFAHVEKQTARQVEFNRRMESVKDEIMKLGKSKQDLLGNLKRYQTELEAKRAESTKLKQKYQIYAQIPDIEVNFSGQNKEECDDDSQLISQVFSICQRPTVPLVGGQTLITFEQEEVASQILRMARCSVSCEEQTLDVKPRRIILDPAVKFEIHIDVSKTRIGIRHIPAVLSEERLKDRLELSFSRPSRGGGEVKTVEYDKTSGTGQITFCNSGVAESLALRGRYSVDLDSEVDVLVEPTSTCALRKFQTFCGTPKRTILLDVIKYVELEEDVEEDLAEYLEIHFQKSCNNGGEIDIVKHISGTNTLQAFFCEEREEMNDDL